MSDRSDEFCKNSVNHYPFYSPRFWSGMRFSDHAKLVLRNRMRIHPSRIPMAGLVGICSVYNSGLALVQKLFCESRIQQATVDSPIFVVGHWRSGTTLLHELLSLDDQFCYPTTYQCFVPHHFLVSRVFMEPLVNLLLPRTRPMDNMPAGPRLPQEDEFALVALGAPTTYYRLAFCNEPPFGLELLNLDDAKPQERQRLRKALSYFYKAITLEQNKRLVLKSPPHTGRIRHLSEWFPNAKFVHITRHPYKIFPSTMHLWNSLYRVQGYQLPKKNDERLTQYVLDCFERMYDGYFTQFDQVPSENIIEIKFEQLVENPLDVLWQIYEAFDLKDFDRIHDKVEQYWDGRKDYQPNQTGLGEEIKAEIDQRWAKYIERYDYEMLPVQAG